MIPELGMIEGFFGQPYDWPQRRELVDFLGPHGFAFYLYAPKADPFLRRNWADPYPPDQLDELRRFGAECRDRGVRLGLGLSPFELHLDSDSGWQPAMATKLAQIAETGAEDLAILFDDMRGDVPGLAKRQVDIVHFIAERSAAKRILCCPSYYSDDPILDSAFGARPEHYLEELGAGLDPAIELMWTGEEVVSRQFSPGHLERVGKQMGRKPFLWDNYPVNDGALMSQYLHLRAFTGRPAAIGPHISAHGINLASQPMLSLIPALTLAESYKAGADYEYSAAFERAAKAVLGPELAAMVGQHLLVLQDRGLDRLGERRERLRARYGAIDHPAAREILAWLDGYWTVDEGLVQTQ
jgi:hyaluronoglucosaminidase